MYLFFLIYAVADMINAWLYSTQLLRQNVLVASTELCSGCCEMHENCCAYMQTINWFVRNPRKANVINDED